MSTTTRSSKVKGFKLPVTFDGADNYEQWKKALQGQLFSLIRNTDMDTLTSVSTIDEEHINNNKQHPFEDEQFLEACLEEAIATGLGFQDWVYDADTVVRASLSEQIGNKLRSPGARPLH